MFRRTIQKVFVSQTRLSSSPPFLLSLLHPPHVTATHTDSSLNPDPFFVTSLGPLRQQLYQVLPSSLLLSSAAAVPDDMTARMVSMRRDVVSVHYVLQKASLCRTYGTVHCTKSTPSSPASAALSPSSPSSSSTSSSSSSSSSASSSAAAAASSSSTTPSSSNSDNSGPIPTASTKPKGKLTLLIDKYGRLAVVTYLGVYVCTLAGMYLGVKAKVLFPNFDPLHLEKSITALGLPEAMSEYMEAKLREFPKSYIEFGFAWVLVKFTEPIRVLATMSILPSLSEWLTTQKILVEKEQRQDAKDAAAAAAPGATDVKAAGEEDKTPPNPTESKHTQAE